MDHSLHYSVRQDDLIHDNIEGEIILLNLQNGTYYQIKGSGVAVWQALVNGASADEIADELEKNYAAPRAQILAELDAFLADLLAESILVPNPSNSAATPPKTVVPTRSAEKLPFDAPQLLHYTDMQSLLLLDPVHDVDEQGWPTMHAPPGG